MENNYFSTIPNDIFKNIVYFCNLKEIISLSQTCTKFRYFIYNDFFRYVIPHIKNKLLIPNSNWYNLFFENLPISFYDYGEKPFWKQICNNKTFHYSGTDADNKWFQKGGYNELWQIIGKSTIQRVYINSFYDGYCGSLFLTLDSTIFNTFEDLQKDDDDSFKILFTILSKDN